MPILFERLLTSCSHHYIIIVIMVCLYKTDGDAVCSVCRDVICNLMANNAWSSFFLWWILCVVFIPCIIFCIHLYKQIRLYVYQKDLSGGWYWICRFYNENYRYHLHTYKLSIPINIQTTARYCLLTVYLRTRYCKPMTINVVSITYYSTTP